MPTTQMENVGTFAVTADPTGAAFAPWKSARPGEDVERTGAPGMFTFAWDELVTTDPGAAVPFYAKVFEWSPQAMDMGDVHTGQFTSSKWGVSVNAAKTGDTVTVTYLVRAPDAQ